jgi:hypothetical protein
MYESRYCFAANTGCPLAGERIFGRSRSCSSIPSASSSSTAILVRLPLFFNNGPHAGQDLGDRQANGTSTLRTGRPALSSLSRRFRPSSKLSLLSASAPPSGRISGANVCMTPNTRHATRGGLGPNGSKSAVAYRLPYVRSSLQSGATRTTIPLRVRPMCGTAALDCLAGAREQSCQRAASQAGTCYFVATILTPPSLRSWMRSTNRM